MHLLGPENSSESIHTLHSCPPFHHPNWEQRKREAPACPSRCLVFPFVAPMLPDRSHWDLTSEGGRPSLFVPCLGLCGLLSPSPKDCSPFSGPAHIAPFSRF